MSYSVVSVVFEKDIEYYMIYDRIMDNNLMKGLLNERIRQNINPRNVQGRYVDDY